MLVHGTEHDTQVMREDVARVLAPLGLRLSPAKTQIVHLADGFDFLGFRIQWRRKRGTDKWHVYTFIADRPVRTVKMKIRALTHRQSQQPLGSLLIKLNQIMRGWANYFKHAVAKDRFAALHRFVWWRLIRMLKARHHWSWKDVRRRFTTWNGRWLPITAPGGIELFNTAKVTVTRYRWRGNRIPNRWTPAPT